MEGFGIDAEEYIAAVRAGAIDPHGATAPELEASLEAFDREWRERLLALSDAEVDELARSGSPLPPMTTVVEGAAEQQLRLDAEFAGRMRALEQQSARIEGERRALMAQHLQRALDDGRDSGVAIRELASLAAVELRVSHRGLERRMTEAWQLVRELPAAHEAAAAGRITVGHLRVIEAETRAVRLDPAIEPHEREAVEAELVRIAEATTPGRLRARAKRAVQRVLTTPLQQRHDVARERRAVELHDRGDGMCDLVAHVPAALGAGILDRLTQAARGKPKDDPRTADQFRADALCEVLLAGVVPDDAHGVSPLRAQVAITIPATELLHDEGAPHLPFPAALDGRILVDRDTARWLAGGASAWERLFTDPVTGVARTVDTYRPSAAQRRWLLARDGGCRFPLCAAAGMRADLDHTLDWARGGATSLDNLATLCRGDHVLKHASGWRMRQLGHGVIEWTTPLGATLVDEPVPVGPTFADLRTAAPRGEPAPPSPDDWWSARVEPNPELLRYVRGQSTGMAWERGLAPPRGS
ncbi:HNH endonuclease signature motif containing protein [Agrococcus sediminis]|uniref:HNH endonuclease signature motif containing protein n=1 Tax=Agrococcus sediminis TaxID=2599924 RepID=UPI00341672D8